MTALEKYVRLEALGQWREGPAAPAREVVVSFGDATLVLTDTSDRPLGHWALAGVQAIRAEGGRTVFAMTPDGEEILTIADPEMVAAIAAVSRPVTASAFAPPAARRRSWWPLVFAVALAGLAAAFLPELIRAQAARMVPAETLEEWGDHILLQLMADHGPLCAGAEGRRALAIVGARVARENRPRLRAMDLGAAPVALLPGPTVVLGKGALAQAEDPAEAAGWLALAMAQEEMRPGPDRVMDAAGPAASLRYMLTGRLSQSALDRVAAAALAPPTAEEVGAAYERLRAAGLPTAPFADGLLRAGIPAPPASTEGGVALAPGDWAALRGVCG